MKTNFAKNFRMHRSAVILFALLIVALIPTVLTNVAESNSDSCDMFGTATTFSVGTYPGSVAVGDFNADGKPDLAVANYFGLVGYGGGEVSVLLGIGDGTFQTAVSYGPQANPRSVAVGDFNADGKQDLAIANAWFGGFGVLLGNGDGTFQPTISYRNNGSFLAAVAIADFNADGKQDVLLATQGGVQTFPGNGDGTFLIPSPAGILPTGPLSSVAVGDFNGDGKMDLALAGYLPPYPPDPPINNVAVLRGNGDGTFQTPVNYAAGNGPNSVALGDFNADGNPDLAVANYNGGDVSVLRGNGDGTFQAAVNYAVGSHPKSVAVGDFSGDGEPDLVVANSGSDNVAVLRGNGDGTFQAAVNYAAGSVPYSVAAGDFNGDGQPDLAVANVGTSNDTSYTLNDVSVLLGNACNSAPVANAGADQTVLYAGSAGTAVTLDGSASSDPDGDLLTYIWTGPFPEGGGTATGVSPTVTLPLGESTITLVVNDGTVDSPPDALSVLVKHGFSLGPAQIWLGLKNSDDVGTKFDLLAEVFKNGSLVGSGQLNNVAGGSSGFNNAVLRTINLALSSPVSVSVGDTLSIKLSVRIAVGVTGHRSGTARLWFNDTAANSRFGATIGGTTNDYFLLNAFALGTAAGPGPKKTIDVFVDRAVGGNPFKPFGTWSKTF